MTALRARTVAFSRGATPILSDISFDIRGGTVTAILGANGCGKTTLLDCLSGLLGLTKGEVVIDMNCGGVREREGGNVADAAPVSLHALPIAERARRIAVVPQTAENSFGYTALEIVLMGRTAGASLFAVPTRHDEAAAYEELHRLGIAHLAARRLNRMSGGEQRLVLIARALATRSSVLLLDEPTAHLDFRNQLLIQNLLAELASSREIAIAFTTHLPTDAFSVASHALLMYRDRRHSFGPIGEVLTDVSIRDAFSVDARIVTVHTNGSESHVVVPIQPVGSKDTL
ncbi:MAG: ABC transporter ATP-binding protein [Spirochaetales bacterium]|nr:ABC transporter ATP-binding protein [Spirochaetales bacterium]